MTTAELLEWIERDTASHRVPGHDPRQEHFGYACVSTIGTLFSFAGVTRRAVEEAIQQARLEGVPVLTDGGLRVAQTAEEAFGLYRWLRARMVTQQKTAWAVRSQAMLMQRGEKRKPVVVPEPVYVEVPLWDALDCEAA